MKIIVEDKIPYIHEAIKAISSDVVYLPASDFTNESIRHADVLIVRTRVKCDKALLEGTRVKFIATATIGYDHIDTSYCERMGITWANAPGCNSGSVCQYLHSALVLLKLHYKFSYSNLTLGIIGVGHVGSKIEALAQKLNMQILLNDPIRRDESIDFKHTDLDIICQEADIITFHVPLTHGGKYPTYHLVDSTFFELLNKKIPILINTSRGEVIDTLSIKEALREGKIETAVLDVWENEPSIDTELLADVFLGTPHIAGYSADGKSLASQMALQSIVDFYGLPLEIRIEAPLPADNNELFITASSFDEAVIMAYDPHIDSESLKNNVSKFEYLRSHYGIRRELSAYRVLIK